MIDKVSVIIPCYNCAKTLRQAVDSILNLNISNIQICMVNDGSTDNTLQIMQEYNDKYGNKIKIGNNPKNMGGAYTRNRCVELTNNDWLFCLDSDNMVEKKSFLKGLEMLSNSTYLEAFSQMDFFYGLSGIRIPVRKWYFEKPTMEFADMRKTSAHPVSSGNYFFTKDVFNKVGGYEEDVGALDAYSLGYKALYNNYKIDIIPQSTYYHRLSFNSYWIREKNKNNENLKKLLLRYPTKFTQEELDLFSKSEDVNLQFINLPNDFTRIEDNYATKLIKRIIKK